MCRTSFDGARSGFRRANAERSFSFPHRGGSRLEASCRSGGSCNGAACGYRSLCKPSIRAVGPHLMFYTPVKGSEDWVFWRSRLPGRIQSLSRSPGGTIQMKGCGRFLCSQWCLQIGPTGRRWASLVTDTRRDVCRNQLSFNDRERRGKTGDVRYWRRLANACRNGGDDGTRTRGLCRDSLATSVVSATYILSGGCQSL